MAGSLQTATGLQRWDSPGRPPLLALHGFTGDAEDFVWLAGRSRHALDWWALNLPGHGNTFVRDPQSLTLENFLDAVEAARRRIVAETNQAPILLGYSMGGRVALHAVARNSAKWRALVTVGATPGIADPSRRLDRLVNDEDLAERMAEQSIDEFLVAWQALPIIQSQDNIPVEILEPLRERRRRNDPKQLAAAMLAVSTGRLPSLWDHLMDMTLPCLITAGAFDDKFCSLARRMEPKLPAPQVAIIPKVGHCAHLEAPDEFLKVLLKFVSHLAD
ncbi:2-succinyl-6-hydroxy-2,4-cyclohexadiene-1-carboxylate synthase [Cerasicoccus frondis]|uniref:2-succinyl-6-hydroxy-2, 4-cyclohexadiene-1-carboxylate synthase n=1 Tax=Cerasicoccus frondis TaxID=490090 RepID=UPI0028525878|nr:2-succinyl-6-hydroxy-2,4-cyclohexadiene-1-carboxylate synthase [Cerasicoccus frondis]